MRSDIKDVLRVNSRGRSVAEGSRTPKAFFAVAASDDACVAFALAFSRSAFRALSSAILPFKRVVSALASPRSFAKRAVSFSLAAKRRLSDAAPLDPGGSSSSRVASAASRVAASRADSCPFAAASAYSRAASFASFSTPTPVS